MARDDTPQGAEIVPPPLPATAPVEPPSPATAAFLDTSFTETKRLRHDGWDGPKMAAFCQALAETGVVTEACLAAGMSAKSAYALRHRDPVFEKAWEAALSMARARLADELLARSLKGSAEQIIRDGCIWGERHHFDNKLAFAILRRLDRRAELGATFRMPPSSEVPAAPPATSGDWQPLLDALKEDRTDDAALLLTPLPPGRPKGNEGNDPPVEEGEDGGEEDGKLSHSRVWQKWDTDQWRTDYPPPPGFEGQQDGEWADDCYSRELSDDELSALVEAGIIESEPEPVYIEEDEAERDAFFASLAAVTPTPEPGSACCSPLEEKADAGSSPA